MCNFIFINDWTLILLMAGLLPFDSRRGKEGTGTRKVIRATFWSLTIRRRRDGSLRSWSLRVLLIERLRQVIWAVVEQLKKD